MMEKETTTDHSTFKFSLLVEFSGSLAELAKSEENLVWTLENPSVFTKDMNEAEKKVIKDNELLKNGLLIGAELENLYSTLPFVVSIDIPDIKSKKYHDSYGNASDYFAFPMQQTTCVKELMDRKYCLECSYFQKHSQYMPQRFKTGFWTPEIGSPFTYVPKDHPAVEFINKHANEAQLILRPKNVIDDKYHKIENSMLNEACNEMLPKLKQLFFESDLTNFQVKISRADRRKMDDPAGDLGKISEKLTEKVMNMHRTLKFILVLEIAFVTSI